MKEFRFSIPEGCKAVTVKVDGGEVTTEFKPEWKPQDGDFLTDILLGTIVIYAGTNDYGGIITYAGSCGFLQEKHDIKRGCGFGLTKAFRPATEEEKQRLLDVLAKEGYRWNAEKKELEKLPRWRADKGGKYYIVYSDSSIDEYEEGYEKYYSSGNYFRTREAAERVAVQISEIFKNSKAE